MDAEKEKRFRFQMQYEQEQAQQTQTAPPAVDPTNASPEWDAAMEAPSIGGKVWNALQVPSQMSSRGLNAIASAVPNPEPTGNLPMDLIKGAPRIAAETMAEAAPGFINRGSIVTAGAAGALQAARPIGSVVGKGVSGQLEDVTNSVPGSLARAWNDPTLIVGKGKKAAGALYNAGKAELDEGANIFKNMYKPEQIIDKAQEYMAAGGKLEPAEALVYRKALDVAGRSRNVVKDGLIGMRREADEIVKQSENLAGADATFKRGLDSESLRRLVPQNKYGGASAFKMAMMGFLTNALGPAGAGVLSPAVHGAVATGGGLASRVATNPAASVATKEAYRKFIEKNKKKK